MHQLWEGGGKSVNDDAGGARDCRKTGANPDNAPQQFFRRPVPVPVMVKGNFWLGAAVGFVIMVFTCDALPVLGPILGGFIAGLIARGGIMNGIKAGFAAGILGAFVTIILGLVIGTIAFGLFGFLAALGIGVVMIVLALYFAVLGAAGGGGGRFDRQMTA